ncbi:MAG: enoyl-CoA hydratase-related protein [Bacillota bacterium]
MDTRDFSTLETVLVESNQDAVVLTIHRPSVLNSLNGTALKEIATVLDAVEADDSVPALIITGQGPKAFIGGADIAAMEPMNPLEASEFSAFGQAVFSRIAALPIVVIAAVNGYALGGGNELAMACDFRVAARNARFGQPEVGLGITPGFGGTQRLARLVGLARALDLTLTGRIIDAEEAFRIGLVDRLVPEGEALPVAMAIAKEVGKKSPFAVRQIKKAVSLGLDLPAQDGLLLERRLFGECFSHADQKEGMRAFLEKRPPSYTRR